MPDLYKKEHELFQLLYKNTSLQVLCNKTAQLLGSPVAVGDFFWNKIAMSENFPEDDIDDQINRLRHLPECRLQNISERLFYDLQDRKPHIRELTYMRRRRICCGVFYRDRLTAFLEIPDTGENFASLDLDFVKVCSDMIGLALQFNQFPSDKAMRHPYTLLWNHFHLGPKSGRRVDWTYCSEFAAIDHFRLFWTDSSTQARAFYDAVNGLSFPHWVLPLSDGILYLADADAPDLCKKLRELAQEFGIPVGASCVFTDLNELDEAKRQAQCSCAYAQHNRVGAGLADYNDYKLQDLLSQAGKAFSLRPFCDEVLLQIREHDHAHQTEYEQTLRVYLASGQSLQATANLLFIHKNTVIYRIGKLRELFGINFGDCRQLAQLYCSFLIVEGESAVRQEQSGSDH